jgi:hypothetical protein
MEDARQRGNAGATACSVQRTRPPHAPPKRSARTGDRQVRERRRGKFPGFQKNLNGTSSCVRYDFHPRRSAPLRRRDAEAQHSDVHVRGRAAVGGGGAVCLLLQVQRRALPHHGRGTGRAAAAPHRRRVRAGHAVRRGARASAAAAGEVHQAVRARVAKRALRALRHCRCCGFVRAAHESGRCCGAHACRISRAALAPTRRPRAAARHAPRAAPRATHTHAQRQP